MTRVIAIDWSGRRQLDRFHIWLAEVREGRLVRLENGRTREEMGDHLVDEMEGDPRMVVGFDFAFSLPAWFLRERGLRSAPALWRLVAEEGEAWLEVCEPPFWGRPRKPAPEGFEMFRRTEKEAPPIAGVVPKSAFQVGGAGAVGTGSLRGMVLLERLRAEGFSIWPFDRPRTPVVVEIYPRQLTGPIYKRRPRARVEYLERHLPDLAPEFRDLAASSEDAFDAACSALVMDSHRRSFPALKPARDALDRLEGRIWLPRS